MRLIFPFLFLLIFNFSKSQNFEIIGTKHNGNKNLNETVLYQKLDEEKPDIILVEGWQKYKKVRGLKIGKALGIWKPTIEQIAIQSYKSKHKNVLIIPIDSIFDHNSYSKILDKNLDSINGLLKKTNFKTRDSVRFEEYRRRNSIVSLALENYTLNELNENHFVNQFSEYYNADREFLEQVLHQYYPTSTVTKWFSEHIIFTNERDKFMSNKISKILSKYKNEKIILLVGLAHKKVIQDYLATENPIYK